MTWKPRTRLATAEGRSLRRLAVEAVASDTAGPMRTLLKAVYADRSSSERLTWQANTSFYSDIWWLESAADGVNYRLRPSSVAALELEIRIPGDGSRESTARISSWDGLAARWHLRGIKRRALRQARTGEIASLDVTLG